VVGVAVGVGVAVLVGLGIGVAVAVAVGVDGDVAVTVGALNCVGDGGSVRVGDAVAPGAVGDGVVVGVNVALII
jgi:hypothetical protein